MVVAREPPTRTEHDDLPNSPEVEAAYAAVPEDMKAEIIEGVFYMMNRPAVAHARAGSRLVALLLNTFDLGHGGGPGGWVLLAEPELHLGRKPDKVGPDLAGWRRERMPKLPQDTKITLAPDWICEVLSRSSEDRDRGAKMRACRREGVGHYWLVDPIDRVLEVYKRAETRWDLIAEHRAGAAVRAEPFEAVELDLALLRAD